VQSGDETITDGQGSNLQLTISEDQEVGEMITVTSEEAIVEDGHEEEVVTAGQSTRDNGEATAEILGHPESNVIVVKQM